MANNQKGEIVMLFASLVTAAAAASKWLIAAKIMTTVGAAMVAVSPAVEKMKSERK